MGYAVNVKHVGDEKYDVYTSSTPLESAKPKPIVTPPAPKPRTATATKPIPSPEPVYTKPKPSPLGVAAPIPTAKTARVTGSTIYERHPEYLSRVSVIRQQLLEQDISPETVDKYEHITYAGKMFYPQKEKDVFEKMVSYGARFSIKQQIEQRQQLKTEWEKNIVTYRTVPSKVHEQMDIQFAKLPTEEKEFLIKHDLILEWKRAAYAQYLGSKPTDFAGRVRIAQEKEQKYGGLTKMQYMEKSYDDTLLSGFGKVLRVGSVAVMTAFRPETWVAYGRGGGGIIPSRGGPYAAAESALEWEYDIQKTYGEKKDWKGFLLGPGIVQSSAYINVVYPFVAGAGMGSVFSTGGRILSGAGTGGRILGTGVPLVVGGGMAAVVGADVGYTAALEKQGLVEKDTTLSKVMGYGMQFTSAAAGFRWSQAPSTKLAYQQSMGKFKSGIQRVPGYKPLTTKISTFQQIGREHIIMKQMVKGHPFHVWEGKQAPIATRLTSVGSRAKMFLFEPAAHDYLMRYGKPVSRAGILSEPRGFSREAMSTLEQVRGKRISPFAARTPPSKWGAYETSWEFYRGTLTPTSIVKSKLEIPWKGKILLDKTGATFLESGKIKPLSLDGRIVDVGAKFGYPEFESRLPRLSGSELIYGKQDIVTGKLTSLKFPKYKPFKETIVSHDKTVLKTIKGYSKPLSSISDIKQYEWYQTLWKEYISVGVGRTGRMPGGYAAAYGFVDLAYLESLEEGIGVGVHPHWKLERKIDKASVVDLESAMKVGVASMQMPATELGVGVISATELKTVPMTDRKLASELASELGLEPVSVSATISSNALLQSQLQAQAQAQIQMQTQLQVPKLQFKTIQTFEPFYDYDMDYSPQPPEQPPPRLFPMLPLDSRKAKLGLVGTGQSYDVFVKDRYIVHGKKKHMEKFTKMNKRPLSYDDAMGLGGTIVDNSAAASFKIKPTKGISQRPSISVTPWSMMRRMFYSRNDVFIEHTDHRINTPGEIAGISARGWAAQRRQIENIKPIKIKEPKKARKTQMDTGGLDLWDDVNIDFNKLFRRTDFGF